MTPLLFLSLNVLSDYKTVHLLGVKDFEFVEVYEGPDDPNLLIIVIIPFQESQCMNKAENTINVVFGLLLVN